VSGPWIATTRQALASVRATMPGRVAVVMTMGALHAGHARLIEVAKERADSVLVTIFVNPLQFAVGEDLQRYPRDLDADLAICAREGVDVVFTPSVEVMYPEGEPLVPLDAGELGRRLEGASRPTHFNGVLMAVARLLELTKPDIALFGEKDGQQLELIRRMVAAQGFPVEIMAVAVVRDPDGLALSSRNRYLTPADREAALVLSRALQAAADIAAQGPAASLAKARSVLAGTAAVAVDYLEVVDNETWLAADDSTRNARILVAARVGSTRLIDNVSVVFASHDDPDHEADARRVS
jgi:pantoate--beta-alanine ligase